MEDGCSFLSREKCQGRVKTARRTQSPGDSLGDCPSFRGVKREIGPSQQYEVQEDKYSDGRERPIPVRNRPSQPNPFQFTNLAGLVQTKSQPFGESASRGQQGPGRNGI